MNKLAPSILAADFNHLGEDIKAVENTGVKMLHIDVMDGVFVPSISFGMPVIKSIRSKTDMFFDVHLMIVDPERYIDAFKECGADSLTIHVEACKDVPKTLELIHAAGMKAGLSINPETPIETIYPYVGMAEMYLVMTVHPGFGGQTFINETIEKISALKKYMTDNNKISDIQVDGGIYLHNVDKPLSAGANVIVAGTAVFRGEIEANIQAFKAEMGINE